MSKMWTRLGVAGRLIASYVLLLALPILFIFAYLFPQIQQRMVDAILISQESNIVRLSGVLDMHLASMVENVVEFEGNALLRPYAIQKDTMGEYYATTELKKTLVPSGMVSQYYYYLKGNNRFYTTASVYPLDWLTNKQYGYRYLDWPKEDMYRELQALTSIQVRPLERIEYPNNLAGRVVSVMMPVPVSSTMPYAVLIIWLDEAALTHLIDPIEQKAQESTFIYDGMGQLLYANNAVLLPLDADALNAALPNQPKSGAQIVSIQGKNYVYAAASQGSFQWKCVSLYPLDLLMEEVRAVRTNIVLIIALLVLMSGILIFTAVRSHYLPIRTLAIKAGQYVSSSPPYNEFDVVHSALDHLTTKAEVLQSRIQSSLPMLRMHQLYALAGGVFDEIEEFNQSSSHLDLIIHHPHLCIVLVRADTQEPQEIVEYLMAEINHTPRGMEAYYTLAFNHEVILAVLAGQSPEAIALYMNDTCQDIQATFGCSVQAAIGRCVLVARDMRVSYSDASACLEKMVLMGSQGVILSGTISNDGSSEAISLLYQVDFAIAKLDAQQIALQMEAILVSMQQGIHSVPMVHTMYHHILASLLRGIQTFEVDSAPYKTYEQSQLHPSFEAIAANLRTLTQVLVGLIEQEEQKSEASIEEVETHIKENCLQYAFSIQAVAEHFGMSYSGFSHFYKRNTGESCKRYVDEYRAQQAIARIMNTMDSLESIAQSVGFANASSFIRSFKKTTGRTPGSYRHL